jgi:hypothetical protein
MENNFRRTMPRLRTNSVTIPKQLERDARYSLTKMAHEVNIFRLHHRIIMLENRHVVVNTTHDIIKIMTSAASVTITIHHLLRGREFRLLQMGLFLQTLVV